MHRGQGKNQNDAKTLAKKWIHELNIYTKFCANKLLFPHPLFLTILKRPTDLLGKEMIKHFKLTYQIPIQQLYTADRSVLSSTKLCFFSTHGHVHWMQVYYNIYKTHALKIIR